MFFKAAMGLSFCVCLSLAAYAAGETPSRQNPHPAKGVDKAHENRPDLSFHTCTSCHPFNEPKFKALVGSQEINIENFGMVGQLWEVSYAIAGRQSVVYASISFDRLYYGHNAPDSGKSYTGGDNKAGSPGALNTSLIPVRDAVYVMGNVDAKKKIVVFDDLACPLCAQLHVELKSFLADHKDYAVYVMLFPTPGDGKAEERAKGVYCIRSLATKETVVENAFKSLLEKKQAHLDFDTKCDASGLDRVKRYATDVLTIKEAPALVLPDGNLIKGYVGKKDLEEILSGRTNGEPLKTISRISIKGAL